MNPVSTSKSQALCIHWKGTGLDAWETKELKKHARWGGGARSATTTAITRAHALTAVCASSAFGLLTVLCGRARAPATSASLYDRHPPPVDHLPLTPRTLPSPMMEALGTLQKASLAVPPPVSERKVLSFHKSLFLSLFYFILWFLLFNFSI